MSMKSEFPSSAGIAGGAARGAGRDAGNAAGRGIVRETARGAGRALLLVATLAAPLTSLPARAADAPATSPATAATAAAATPAGSAPAAGSAATAAKPAQQPMKVVYHFDEGNEQAYRGLINVRNHLDADPDAKIVVVGHGAGIDFALDGAKDPKGNPFAATIGALANRGVEFRICNNTLQTRGIPKDRLVMEATVVQSGVAEIAKLQAREGFVYLKP